MDEEARDKKQKSFPEDVLNLELKFLDENVRPYITESAEAWRAYMNGEMQSHKVITTIQVLLLQVRPVQRLTDYELEGFEERLWEMWNVSEKQKLKLGKPILTLIREINDKIGDCKMFARPGDEDTKLGAFASLLQDVKKED
jgi:hypothetical protein